MRCRHYAGILALLVLAAAFLHREWSGARSQKRSFPRNFLSIPSAESPTDLPPEVLRKERAQESLARTAGLLALSAGEHGDGVKYCLRDRNVSVFFTPMGPILSAVKGDEGLALQARFVDGREAEPTGIGEQAARVNYLVGDPSKWKTGLPTYEKVSYSEVWPGIDVLYEPRPAGVEYTLLVKPGADPSLIRLAYAGHEGLSLAESGTLAVTTEWGVLSESSPIAYQGDDPHRQEVACRFRLHEDGTVGFNVGHYDANELLVIDPTLSYSVLLGEGSVRNSDRGQDIALRGTYVYLVGDTETDLPVTSGAYDTVGDPVGRDAFVAKFNHSPREDSPNLVWATYLGGSGNDYGTSICVDLDGDAYVTGHTTSSDFPFTSGDPGAPDSGNQDIFVTKIDAGGGSLEWSRRLASIHEDAAWAIGIDGERNVYMAGSQAEWTISWDPLRRNTWVAKISADGSTTLWSTTWGDVPGHAARAIAVRGNGSVYIAGYTEGFISTVPVPDPKGRPWRRDEKGSGRLWRGDGYWDRDAFVAKLTPAGRLEWSNTLLAGSRNDEAYGIAVDSGGNAFVTGYTSSRNFPTIPGSWLRSFSYNGSADVFIAKVNAGGATLGYSTVLAGSGHDEGRAIVLDSGGFAYVAGSTQSPDRFPVTSLAYDRVHNGRADAFVAKIAPGGTRSWCTYLGSAEEDEATAIAVDTSRNVYVAGITAGGDFPTTYSGFDQSHNGGEDAFIARLTSDGRNLAWSTLFGGGSDDAGQAMTIDASENVFLTGSCSSVFPRTVGAFPVDAGTGRNAFVTKLYGDATLGSDRIAWSTYLGGNGADSGRAIAIDASGFLYVTGHTTSTDFPASSSSLDDSPNGGTDCFVTQLTPDGASLGWSTYVGGTMADQGHAIAVDTSGNVYVAGRTWSGGFPVSGTADDPVFNDGPSDDMPSDGFVLKMTTDGGTLHWATFLGGGGDDTANALALDTVGNCVVTGTTRSSSFPMSSVANRGQEDAFLARFTPAGILRTSTLLGSTGKEYGTALILDSLGDIYVTGSARQPEGRIIPLNASFTTLGAYDRSWNGRWDVFVARLNPAMTLVRWATLIGGRWNDHGNAIALDGSGNVLVTGSAGSGFPTPGGDDTSVRWFSDAFLAKLDPTGSALLYATYFGGDTGSDVGNAIRVAPSGAIFVAGTTASSDFPGGGFYHGGSDAFVARFEP